MTAVIALAAVIAVAAVAECGARIRRCPAVRRPRGPGSRNSLTR
ncbi:hypothetical protein Ae505Ps2_2945 [Pseudonocardia sp. Ae505_Ps2]|nr:hypothetical protein Ae505Ps2_2945 [Pseudonocardia sp. Ae505_Ps2]